MTKSFQQGHALVVGVGADLPMTVDDAKRIASMLLDEGRCAYPTEQVTLLTGEQAGRSAVLRGLEQLAAVDPESMAVVYFSGHGIQAPGYYILPFGYNLSVLPETAISGAEFSAALHAIQARKLLVLLDCCHAGGQADLKGIAKAPIPADALASLARGSGRVIIASSRKDELSWAGSNSYFTMALLEALAGSGAAELDGYARVLDIALWIGRRVPDLARDRQHPMIKVSNLEDNYAVAWYAGSAKAVAPLPGTGLDYSRSPESTMEAVDGGQRATWQKMLANYRENLLLIEERMSEFVEFSAIPLQLVRSHRQTTTAIDDLERKLGFH